MKLAVNRLQVLHSKGSTLMRRKLEGNAVEQASHRACIVIALAKEFCAETPVPEDRVWSEFVDVWSAGSEQADMEIQSVLLEQAEAGRVLDVVRLPSPHSNIAASYVIETPNCGKLQWLTERHGMAEGDTTLLPAAFNEQLSNPDCVLAQGLSRAWTALDYSS